jgi:hypothetical protein
MLVPLTLLLLLLTACSNTVTIRSIPTGATVILDGTEVGETPYTAEMTSATVVGTRREVELRLPGFRPVHGRLDSTYDPRHLVWLVGIWFPFSQFIHLHPMQHRVLYDDYLVILQEDVDGSAEPDKRLLFGRWESAE